MESNSASSQKSFKTANSLGTNDPVKEIPSFTMNSARKSFVIPKLDEKQLEMKLPEMQVTAQPFVVLEGTANIAVADGSAVKEGGSVPLNTNAPAFVLGSGSMYNCGTIHGVDSPSANAGFFANMQQLSQCKIPNTPTTEQELLLTHSYIQMYPREVLMLVLSSLVNENPALCPLIRQRCEKAVVYISQQQQKHQQAVAAGRFATHVSAGAQWVLRPSTSNYNSPHAASFAGGASPHASGGRKARGGKFREEALCSLHNSMRSINHLHINKQTGLYECVSGFHCLEDGGSAAVTPCSFKNATTTNTAAPNANANTLSFVVGDTSASNHAAGRGAQPVLGTLSDRSLPQWDGRYFYDVHLGCSGGSHRSNNENGHSGITPFEDDEASAQQHVTGLKVEMLQSLLQSVRELAGQEGN